MDIQSIHKFGRLHLHTYRHTEYICRASAAHFRPRYLKRVIREDCEAHPAIFVDEWKGGRPDAAFISLGTAIKEVKVLKCKERPPEV